MEGERLFGNTPSNAFDLEWGTMAGSSEEQNGSETLSSPRGRRNGVHFSSSNNTEEFNLKPVIGSHPKRSSLRTKSLEDSLRSMSFSEVSGDSHVDDLKQFLSFMGSRRLLIEEEDSETRSGSTSREDASEPSEHGLAKVEEEGEAVQIISPKKAPIKRSVRFGVVNSREYETVPSVNPAVTCGAAVGIGWNYMEMKPVLVDDFEKHHPRRRKSDEMKLDMRTRMKRLRDFGHSKKDIQKAVKQINIARRKRRSSLESLQVLPLLEKWEDGKRGLSKLMCMRQTEDEAADELWDRAQQVY